VINCWIFLSEILLVCYITLLVTLIIFAKRLNNDQVTQPAALQNKLLKKSNFFLASYEIEIKKFVSHLNIEMICRLKSII